MLTIIIGTLTGLQWMTYVSITVLVMRFYTDKLQDYFKIVMGFPTTGGAAPPEKK